MHTSEWGGMEKWSVSEGREEGKGKRGVDRDCWPCSAGLAFVLCWITTRLCYGNRCSFPLLVDRALLLPASG